MPWQLCCAAVSFGTAVVTKFSGMMADKGYRELRIALGDGPERAAIVKWVEWFYLDSPAYLLGYLVAAGSVLLAFVWRWQWAAAGLTVGQFVLCAAMMFITPTAYWLAHKEMSNRLYDKASESGHFPDLKPRSEAEAEWDAERGGGVDE